MNFRFAAWLLTALAAGSASRAEEFIWLDSGPGVAVTRVTNEGPVLYTVVRIERSRLNKDLTLVTTLASNTVVGLDTLSNQVRALPKELGTPVAAINADFFMMSGTTTGEPRGLQIVRGELVSVPTGPAAFWLDSLGKIHGEPVRSRLTLSWPGGGTNFAGLNEQLGTNALVLFTPSLGRLYNYREPTNRAATTSRAVTNRTNTTRSTSSSSVARPGTNAASSASQIPKGGPVRPPGGREWTLAPDGPGPWLPLSVGRTYQARTVTSSDGFTNVPPGMMLMTLGSNLVATLPELTNGTPVTITVATAPDLRGVTEALGTGPMLVLGGQPHETTARMSEQLHPRSALGWNDQHLFLAVADGRQTGLSVGLRLPEMADFLVTLGCREAINMDGGVSTTLMLNGRTINSPSFGISTPKNGPPTQGRQRPIKNAVVILRKTPPTDDSAD
jgi:hypothetical protein